MEVLFSCCWCVFASCDILVLVADSTYTVWGRECKKITAFLDFWRWEIGQWRTISWIVISGMMCILISLLCGFFLCICCFYCICYMLCTWCKPLSLWDYNKMNLFPIGFKNCPEECAHLWGHWGFSLPLWGVCVLYVDIFTHVQLENMDMHGHILY